MTIKKAIMAVAMFAFLLLAYSFQVALTVRMEATQIAGKNPFCLQVAASDRYVEARNFIDFFPIFMRGHGGYHHAVLIVGKIDAPIVYHWSYFQNSFVSGGYTPFPICCSPSRNYFDGKKTHRDRHQYSFTLNGVSMSIPEEYSPEPDWPGSFVGFHFFADPPMFKSSKKDFSNGLVNYIGVSFSIMTKLNRLMANSGSDRIVTSLNPKYGLDRQLVKHRDEKFGGYYEFYSADKNGNIVTRISCAENMHTPCSNEFVREGWEYRFNHSPDDIAQWKEMQNNLVSRVMSFRVDQQTKKE
jgi:hypothetical protein